MEIGELRNGMSGVSVSGRITEISERRTVNTRYGKRDVADATLEDESGSIKLVLWGNQIDKVSVGDTINVKGAYVTEFRNELQLNVPRSGSIEKV